MFGSIPNERIHAHDWRGGCVRIGEVPAEFVEETTQGAADWPIPIVLNRMLMEEPWDLIINVGHVVPHEVLGFANHNKNYFIGLGGKDLICAAHMAAACCGIENNLGNLITPVRAVLQPGRGRVPRPPARFVRAGRAGPQRPRTSSCTPASTSATIWKPTWRPPGSRASRTSRCSTSRVKKIVCVMQGDEFFSTWVANKAVYRTRMALADGGELVDHRPRPEAVRRAARSRRASSASTATAARRSVMEQYRKNADMQDLAHATAHLMHGSQRRPVHDHLRPRPPVASGNRGRQLRATPTSTKRSRRYRPERLQARLEHDRRRRAVLLHPHALRRAVGDGGPPGEPRMTVGLLSRCAPETRTARTAPPGSRAVGVAVRLGANRANEAKIAPDPRPLEGQPGSQRGGERGRHGGRGSARTRRDHRVE